MSVIDLSISTCQCEGCLGSYNASVEWKEKERMLVEGATREETDVCILRKFQ